jgi:5-hydroxyisourate hydrolase-like protein (transthyretin family)
MPAIQPTPNPERIISGLADPPDSTPRTLAVGVTDLARGRAAEGVLCVIEVQVNGKWRTIARAVSDPSGMISVDVPVVPGSYRVELDAEPYFASTGVLPLMPRATIAFRLSEACGHSLLRAYITACSHFAVLVTSDYPINPARSETIAPG